jgi:sugar-specific transcriptional regulator TrmB
VDTQILTLLKEYGLDDRETSVYLDLVGKNRLTAYRIAKDVKFNRSTTYYVLERLISQGFVSKIENGSTSLFCANDMNRITSRLKDKETILTALIPKLKLLETNAEPQIKIYEGVDGQKQFDFDLFLQVKERKISFVYIIGNTYSSSLSSNIFIERLIKELDSAKNKKIDRRGIWDARYRKDKILALYNKIADNRFLDSIPSKSGTVIYDNTVAFMFTSEKPYVIEIRNSLVAEEMKSYFSHLWSMAKK